jgi:hypothetical protein
VVVTHQKTRPRQLAFACLGMLLSACLSVQTAAAATPPGAVTEFASGITPASGPAGITQGPDGNVWFIEFTGNRIGRVAVRPRLS